MIRKRLKATAPESVWPACFMSVKEIKRYYGNKNKCIWIFKKDICCEDQWKTSCNCGFLDNPYSDIDFTFCPYCGREIQFAEEEK